MRTNPAERGPNHRLASQVCKTEDLEAELDPRLADVWIGVFELWPDNVAIPAQLSGLLRMAYVQGYGDGLTEEQRGSLFENLGMTPPAAPRRRPQRRRKGVIA